MSRLSRFTGFKPFSISLILLFMCDGIQSTEKEEPKQFSLLTLNLHTYQEFSTSGERDAELDEEDALQRVEDHGIIFDKIANAINDLNVDIICLQEVGEWKDKSNNEFGNHESNAALQILKRLKDKNYDVYMDWSHYGWDVWKEGSAIISRFPMTNTESKYISNTKNGTKNFWQSRNVIKAQLKLNDSTNINVFSVHAGWWKSELETFQEQYKRLRTWINESTAKNEPTILCGDFNQPAGEQGYQLMTKPGDFIDLYLKANPNGMYDNTIGGEIAGWKGVKKGQRIDYLFMDTSTSVNVVKSELIFVGKKYGRVSDHTGLYAKLKLSIKVYK